MIALAEKLNPTVGFWDPLDIVNENTIPETIGWFRHAEIKHGRVAMAGIVGLLFHINHIHFSGYLSPTFGVSFEDLSNMGPFDAWNAVPLLGQLQASAADPPCVS